MEKPFILSIDELISFVDSRKNEFLKISGGACRKCPRLLLCKKKSKESYIETIKHMDRDATRFPKLLGFVQNHKALLEIVPSSIYRLAYGLFSPYLPCPFDSKIIVENIPKVKEAYELFDDSDSKLAFLNVLMYRLTLSTDYINRALCMHPHYFIPAYRGLCADEVYVDCGAYIGDTFAEYCLYNSQPRKAYMFEPDNANISTMKQQLQKYKETEFEVIKKGVYKTSGSLYFITGEKTSSRLSETSEKGSVKIEVASIDEQIKEDVTFIKMDIEGSEKAAIIGAKNHILKTYPKLAICVYHQVRDLWEIPLMIHEFFPEYNCFEFHHHSTTFNETVLYVYKNNA